MNVAKALKTCCPTQPTQASDSPRISHLCNSCVVQCGNVLRKYIFTCCAIHLQRFCTEQALAEGTTIFQKVAMGLGFVAARTPSLPMLMLLNVALLVKFPAHSFVCVCVCVILKQAIAVVWYLQDLSKKALKEIDSDFGEDDATLGNEKAEPHSGNTTKDKSA